MYERIGIVGAGSWGTALAILLSESSETVCLWGRRPALTTELASHHINSVYLPGLQLPSNIHATHQLADALDAKLILVVTPSKAIREIVGQIVMLGVAPQSILVSCIKGIEYDTGMLMSEVLASCLPHNPLAVLSGPNHAIEVAQKRPAAAVVGSANGEVLQELQQRLFLPSFRLYTSEDVRGIQLGGALKNVFAIAAGISDGFHMGSNAKAALITRALAEMRRLGVASGGHLETFYGLSGIGDLMVTCFSQHSRNRAIGERIGRGEFPAKIQESMKMIAEGIPAARSARRLALKHSVDTPILEAVYQVLYEGKTPRDALWELLGRRPRPESDPA
ncbi:MAG: NAD(P)-dependent glycerol-3-phosphate dehydrogenase [Candidatus Xiphinematobacter sp.]|nr:MAG: NAD(P)-dependent glycerol-3-phosphate dehydrogenase [Candidatus Xiphinematobacter sp.]QQY09908.1 MAG: NAD(P)-dependent glycerol-3-phosphate dehydrogenase [Candidatus Xiphinematobacter sp.]QQY10642.1 MAG: NAD(P)-dependent glycerol-3-phosphate dehydrogenase [Candidatus Xiphinematobacter sp.]QQY11384.1 MAG: NAD(P)-dependent glycerol-3-phosphate dehydrogenase [Candidatus Xiphinematobacter sp.]